MTDYARLRIQGKTDAEILEQVSNIQKFYANYDGERLIKIVNTFGKTTTLINLSEIENAMKSNELISFLKKLPTNTPYIEEKELMRKLADGETSQSIRRERRKDNKENSFSKKLFKRNG